MTHSLCGSLYRLIPVLCLMLSIPQASVAQGGGRGFGRGGWGMDENTPLVKNFDRDGNGWLNTAERKAALAFLGFEASTGRRDSDPQVGVKVSPTEVKSYPGKPLYEPLTVRTLFIKFDTDNWEQELHAFHGTDVEIPATVMLDAQGYRNVGVRFRGQTSYMMVPEGSKHSLNLSVDMADENQRIMGYRTLELLNAAGDPTFLRTVLYMHIAREYLPAPKANYMRVVINGEDWGIYVNSQQFNTDFTKEAVDSKGPRWKVKGRPGGQGGLEYLGDDAEYYKLLYDIKSKDMPESWAALIKLCKVLNETPPERLESAIKSSLDIDQALKFLALENVFINNDGYWVRASDYSLYMDRNGRFHLAPHDVNETFRGLESFGRRFGGNRDASATGVALDPLTSVNDPSKALLHRLLAVPSLRQRYLGYVRDIAEKWLNWDRLGPLAQQYQAVIAANVRTDSRKLYSTEAFTAGVTEDGRGEGFGPMSPPSLSLKSFAEQRRAYLRRYFAAGK